MYDKMQSSATLPPLKSEQIKLHIYTGEEINVLGSVSVRAQTETCTCTLPLLVVEGDGPSLIWRNWLTKLRLDRRAVHAISLSHLLEGILEQNKEIFQQGLDKIKGMEVNLHVDT